MTVDLQALTPDALRARRTLKWASQPDDVLAMWVAEMDYPTAPAITAALHRAVDAETFGYPLDAGPSGLADALADDLARRHGWTVDPDDVFLVADVMRGVTLALETFSGRDDPVVITTPVYMPFFDVVELSGRPQVHVPMVEVDGRPTFDLDALDGALAHGARTVLLCNPYNPLGRVLDRAELLAFAEVVERHGARVIADEIHAPLVFEGIHLPYASLSPATASHTVTLVSASKAWNLPGLKCAQVVTEQRRRPSRVAADPAVGQGRSGVRSGSRRASPHTGKVRSGWPTSGTCSPGTPQLVAEAVDGDARGAAPPQRGHLPRLARLHRAGAGRRPGRLVPRARPGRAEPGPAVPGAGPPLRAAELRHHHGDPRGVSRPHPPSGRAALTGNGSQVIVRSTGSLAMTYAPLGPPCALFSASLP